MLHGSRAKTDERQPPQMGWAEGFSSRPVARSLPSSHQEVNTEMNSALPVKHGIYGLAKHEFADWLAIDSQAVEIRRGKWGEVPKI